MKKSLFKKLAAVLLLVLSISSVFTACGNTDNTQGDTTPNADSSSTQSQPAAENAVTESSSESETASPDGKYEPAINLGIVKAMGDDGYQSLMDETPGETIEKNRWVDLYRDKLGINISYDWYAISAQYEEKINVQIASGDLPDLFAVNAVQLKQLAEAGAIADLTEAYETYANDYIRSLMQENDEAALDSARFDGKIMGIPNADSTQDTSMLLFLRQDWLDSLGLQVPTTMQELIEVAKAFTHNDPDKNGKNDTYGIALTKDFYGGMSGSDGFFAGYHAYPYSWVNDAQGKLVYGSILPETKTALTELANLYKEGVIDKEFGVKDGSAIAQDVAAGKVGIEFGQQWNPLWPIQDNLNNDPSAKWIVLGLVSIDDSPALTPVDLSLSTYWVVRKDYEHPEAIVKMANIFLETYFSDDYEEMFNPPSYNRAGVWQYAIFTGTPGTKNLDAAIAIKEARDNGTTDELKGQALVQWLSIKQFLDGDRSMEGWDMVCGNEGSFSVIKKYKENNLFKMEGFTGPPTDTMTERKATLDKMEKETFIKIIMGESTLDEFDSFVENWTNLGGADETVEVNEWRDSLN